MDSRADFQRLLGDMDKVIKLKQQELSELDERLESARSQLSEKEANQLTAWKPQYDGNDADDDRAQQLTLNEYINEMREHYEQQIATINEEFVEYETINQQLAKENSALKNELERLIEASEKFKADAKLLAASLEEAQRANFELNIRLARAESESQMQQNLLKQSNKQDQVLMDAFNDKIEALKQTISERDTQIKRLMAANQFTLVSLGINQSPVEYLNTTNEIELNTEIHSDNQLAQQQFLPTDTNVYVDPNNKLRAMEIVGVIRDKDKQIELLKNQLAQATKDLEQSTSFLESLTRSSAKISYSDDVLESDKSNFESKNEITSRCRLLENELEAKDKLLHSVESRNRYFEVILPSRIIEILSELREVFTNQNRIESVSVTNEEIVNLARELNRLLDGLSESQRLLNHIDQLKKINAAKDAHIERLVKDLNELDARCDHDHSLANGEPARKPGQSEALNCPPEEHPNMEFNQLNQELDTHKDLSSTVLDNVDKQIPLPLAEKNLNDQQKEAGESFQTTELHSDQELECKLETATSATDALPNTLNQTWDSPNDNAQMENAPNSENERKSTDQLPIEESSVISSTKTSPELVKVRQGDPLRKRLRQLENENKLLELAMKEILLSIRWSDTRCSTILIDCPSLERLCQLIEARFLSHTKSVGVEVGSRPSEPSVDDESNYSERMFQLVLMKSELDLLRGQNEQLRTDLKLQRHEYQELMSEVTRDDRTSVTNVDEGPSQAIQIECQEVECQTDINTTSDALSEETPVETDHENLKCQNCSSLVRFTRHLLESIVRIETRVNISDETYLRRMATLYELTQRLGRDLSLREHTINHLRSQYNNLNKQKLAIESQLQSLESQLNIYQKVCPINHYLSAKQIAQEAIPENPTQPNNFQVITSSKNGQNQYFHSLTVRSEQRQVEVPLRDSKLTIALLQSIIGCLQARLDYKDERLHQLEEMLTTS